MATNENNSDKSNGTNGALEKASEVSSLLPHLESIDRLLSLPSISIAWTQSQGVYGKVKDFNPMFNWAFRTAEDVVKGAVNISAPIVNAFEQPINYVDQTLVKGIDKLEASAPIIKEQPTEILNQAKTKVLDVVQPRIEKVCELRKSGTRKAASLKELSYNKANEVLATHYGSLAVSGVDSTAALAERLLDTFFPKNEEDESHEDDKPISAAEDPALHTVQTIGALSNKVARRVYRTVSLHVKSLKKEDLTEYLASLIAVLRLTQYLNILNERAQQQEQASTSSEVVKASPKVDVN
ncbi:lipid storage droplets surface-binding protein 2 [Chironomus tepperi]|uniref:lipid storage droplets surface-binding protein 2 n=1 Tax=Chironomus tepperi TaxID=113505 RepID=UPI00391F033F